MDLTFPYNEAHLTTTNLNCPFEPPPQIYTDSTFHFIPSKLGNRTAHLEMWVNKSAYDRQFVGPVVRKKMIYQKQ